LKNAYDLVLLGIINQEHQILLQEASATDIQGHGDWLKKTGLIREEVLAGFSLVVRNGEIVSMFTSSILNDPPCYQVPVPLLEQLKTLLPPIKTVFGPD
jgi:hypothetical protein